LHAVEPEVMRRPQRMIRGRCGSLLLHRNGLVPATPCRSPGALHKIPLLEASPYPTYTTKHPYLHHRFVNRFQ
jgi:hypothetical protein